MWLRHVTKCCLKSVIQSLLIPMCFSGFYHSHSTGSLGKLQDSLQTSAKSSLSTLSELCFSEFGKNRNHLVTLHSDSGLWSGYKKWPLPLVKHQRKTNYMQNNSPGQQTMMGGRFWPMRAQCCDWPDQWQDRKPCRPLECEGISRFSLSQLPLVKT